MVHHLEITAILYLCTVRSNARAPQRIWGPLFTQRPGAAAYPYSLLVAGIVLLYVVSTT